MLVESDTANLTDTERRPNPDSELCEVSPHRLQWIEVKDGNLEAFAMFRRHYTYNRRRDQMRFWREANDVLFVGPGEKLVLMLSDCRALFVWRKFRSMDEQPGVCCAVFRNESEIRASDLIRQAQQIAWKRWPGERLYTYVDPRRIRPTNQPGRCFKKAGWRYVHTQDGRRYLTKKSRLPVLEIRPEWSALSPKAAEISAACPIGPNAPNPRKA